MKASPFLIHKDASGGQLDPVGERERAYHEDWLQELLRQHPGILPAAEIEPVFHPLISIGREIGTATGSIDNLFISPRGYLVVVETKLWRNPQARREVVAQAIDYASSLSKWTYSRLDKVVRAYLKTYESADCDLLGWVEKRHGPVEGGRQFFEETVAKNLRLGRFLTMIVGDRIQQSLVDMLSHVNRYPHLATDVALVELLCYRWDKDHEWPLLVVPSIVARTEIVERSVVQVTVKQDGTHEVDVSQERAEESKRGRERVTLTEEAFWELLRERCPDGYQEAYRLIEEFRTTDGVTIDPSATGLIVRFDVPATAFQITVFFIQTSGILSAQPGTGIQSQLIKAGLDPQLVDRYHDQLSSIMNTTKTHKEFNCSITKVDVNEFIAAVHAFIEEIRRAADER